MKTIAIALSTTNNASVRLEGLSAHDFLAATWRGQDLLVQMKNGHVLVFQGADAKRLNVPGFFLVFDDTSVPLALFAPGLPQPALGIPPHVPPFEGQPPVKVARLPGGKSRKPGKAALPVVEQDDDAWADRAMAELERAETLARKSGGSSQLTSTAAMPVGAPHTTDTSKAYEAEVQDLPQSASSMSWAWSAVMLGAGAGAVAAKSDGSFIVTLAQKPATDVIRVVVEGVSDGLPDFMGEDKIASEFVGTVSAVTTLAAGIANKLNVTHATDVLARQLKSSLTENTKPEEVNAVSAAFAQKLGVGDGTTPLEQIAPQATVAIGADGKVVDAVAPDLHGQVLKVLFEQVKQAQTTASDNVAVSSYAFAGGVDDGKFNLNKASFNFQALGSAAGSNAYTVKATDATNNSSTQTITVNATNVNEAHGCH